jgi:diaminopimelate decarboxylase
MGLRVSGVSFHVGSGASNPDAFTEVPHRAVAGDEHAFVCSGVELLRQHQHTMNARL